MLKTKYKNLRKVITVFSLLVMETHFFSNFWDVGGVGLANFSYMSKRRVRTKIPTLVWQHVGICSLNNGKFRLFFLEIWWFGAISPPFPKSLCMSCMAHFFFWLLRCKVFAKKKKQWMATLQNHIIFNFLFFFLVKFYPFKEASP